ncbi:MAG: hypothetical protein U1G08_19010 [Verrucomicrobiota bacterium]
MLGKRVLLSFAALDFYFLAHGRFRQRSGTAVLEMISRLLAPSSRFLAYIEDYRLGPIPKEWSNRGFKPNGNLLKSGGFVRDGIFDLGVVDIPGTTPGGAGVVIIRGWDSRIGASAETWAKAWQIVTLSGLGGGAIPPPRLAQISNFSGLIIYGRLTPTPPTDITTTVDSSSAIRIAVHAWPVNYFGVWKSEDLLHWSVGAPVQLVGESGVVEWTLEATNSHCFYLIDDPINRYPLRQ